MIDGMMGLYVPIVQHGLIAFLVLLDGLLLNNIQIRARQIVGVWIFQTLYLLWSGLYALLGLTNPEDNEDDDTMSTDNGIYPGLLSWRKYPEKTTMLAFAVLVVLTPILFSCVWRDRCLFTRKDTGRRVI